MDTSAPHRLRNPAPTRAPSLTRTPATALHFQGGWPRGLRPGARRAGVVSFEARWGPEGDSAMTMRTYESLPTAAARIGVSVKTIRRRIAEGVLPVYRCGRILRLDPDDVDAMFSRYPQWTTSEFRATGRREPRRAS